nr:MAG TPA: hypothetical protein [Bacteriophage sp.]
MLRSLENMGKNIVRPTKNDLVSGKRILMLWQLRQ